MKNNNQKQPQAFHNNPLNSSYFTKSGNQRANQSQMNGHSQNTNPLKSNISFNQQSQVSIPQKIPKGTEGNYIPPAEFDIYFRSQILSNNKNSSLGQSGSLLPRPELASNNKVRGNPPAQHNHAYNSRPNMPANVKNPLKFNISFDSNKNANYQVNRSFNEEPVKNQTKYNRQVPYNNSSFYLNNTLSQIVGQIGNKEHRHGDMQPVRDYQRQVNNGVEAKKDMLTAQNKSLSEVPVVVPTKKYMGDSQNSMINQSTNPRNMGGAKPNHNIKEGYDKMLKEYAKKDRRVSNPSEILDKSFRAPQNDTIMGASFLGNNPSRYINDNSNKPLADNKVVPSKEKVPNGKEKRVIQPNYSYLSNDSINLRKTYKDSQKRNDHVTTQRKETNRAGNDKPIREKSPQYAPAKLVKTETQSDKDIQNDEPKVVEQIDLANIFTLLVEIILVTINCIIDFVNGLTNNNKKTTRPPQKANENKVIELLLPFDQSARMSVPAFNNLKKITCGTVVLLIINHFRK